MSFRIDSTAFRASMMAARKTLSKLVLDALKQSAERATQLAKTSGLFRQRTGALRQSIQHKVIDGEHSQTSANAPHAAWIEYGNTFRTGAAYIYPKNGKFLRFIGPNDGKVVFARRVRASAPRPFMAEAATKTEPFFDELCRKAVDGMFG